MIRGIDRVFHQASGSLEIEEVEFRSVIHDCLNSVTKSQQIIRNLASVRIEQLCFVCFAVYSIPGWVLIWNHLSDGLRCFPKDNILSSSPYFFKHTAQVGVAVDIVFIPAKGLILYIKITILWQQTSIEVFIHKGYNQRKRILIQVQLAVKIARWGRRLFDALIIWVLWIRIDPCWKNVKFAPLPGFQKKHRNEQPPSLPISLE